LASSERFDHRASLELDTKCLNFLIDAVGRSGCSALPSLHDRGWNWGVVGKPLRFICVEIDVSATRQLEPNYRLAQADQRVA